MRAQLDPARAVNLGDAAEGGDGAGAGAGADAPAPHQAPPGFQNAARREHQAEAAALRALHQVRNPNPTPRGAARLPERGAARAPGGGGRAARAAPGAAPRARLAPGPGRSCAARSAMLRRCRGSGWSLAARSAMLGRCRGLAAAKCVMAHVRHGAGCPYAL